MIFTQEEFEE